MTDSTCQMWSQSNISEVADELWVTLNAKLTFMSDIINSCLLDQYVFSIALTTAKAVLYKHSQEW